MTYNEAVAEIIKRLKAAYVIEKKIRKMWVAAGFPERTAPSAIGLLGTADSGYECTRGNWWNALGCEKLADGLDYHETAWAVEEMGDKKIKNLSFGS